MRGFLLQKKFHILKSCTFHKQTKKIENKYSAVFILHSSQKQKQTEEAQLQPLFYSRFKSNQQLNEYNMHQEHFFYFKSHIFV